MNSPLSSARCIPRGRRSIPPEQLLRALLLQVEEIDYNILFRWFVGLTLDDEVRNATVFTKN
jgi:transposase